MIIIMDFEDLKERFELADKIKDCTEESFTKLVYTGIYSAEILKFFSKYGIKIQHVLYSEDRILSFDMYGSVSLMDNIPELDGGLPNGGLYTSPYSIAAKQEADIVIEENVDEIMYKVFDNESYYIIESEENIRTAKVIEYYEISPLAETN